VHSPRELEDAVLSAKREAESAFGDATLMLERLIEDARHIEVQVFADAHGHVIHLAERDCTAQRRRQKVIEEAPSVVVDAALRARMGEAAVAAARAVGYQGAGTVEFIVDPARNYYFLEMNTRLQVEHPVTELITGLDLVALQLAVAAGEPLPLTQEELVLSGHAIEARLYAEDPYAGFAPQTGQVLHFRPDAGALPAGVRIDYGVGEGGAITPYYDAMVAKFIAHGRTREAALRKLVLALEEVPLLGVRTNARFLIDLLRSEDFREGRMTTTRIDRWAAEGAALTQRPAVPDEAFFVAALLSADGGDFFRSSGGVALELTLCCEGQTRTLTLEGKSSYLMLRLGEQKHPARLLARSEREVRYLWNGVERRRVAFVEGGAVHVVIDAVHHVFTEPSAFPSTTAAEDPSRLVAPLSGVIAQVFCEVGASVNEGDAVLSIEAMKMETRVPARAQGKLSKLHVAPGDRVEAGTLLAELTLDTEGR
jgi:geranyl-CoA carboxylase alpha subunit